MALVAVVGGVYSFISVSSALGTKEGTDLSENHGVIKAGKDLKITGSNHSPSTAKPTAKLCPQVPHLLLIWPFPGKGEPTTMLERPSSEEFFLLFNLNLPWHNLRPFSFALSLVIGEKGPTPHLATPFCQGVVE